MTEINRNFPEKGNAYILFGFEAIQACPNRDPYTSALRMDDETRQMFQSNPMSAAVSKRKPPHEEFPMQMEPYFTRKLMKTGTAAILPRG